MKRNYRIISGLHWTAVEPSPTGVRVSHVIDARTGALKEKGRETPFGPSVPSPEKSSFGRRSTARLESGRVLVRNQVNIVTSWVDWVSLHDADP
jgi:hypothetical protein